MNAKVLLIFLAILIPLDTYAFQCARDQSLKNKFKEAEKVFLAYVKETRLEETKLQEMALKYEQAVGEDVKLVSAGYEVIENFKGDETYKPRLMDMLGIGTGYVGLTPGMYYLVFLSPRNDEKDVQLRYLGFCDVPYQHYRLNEEGFQKEIEKVRSISERKKKKR